MQIHKHIYIYIYTHTYTGTLRTCACHMQSRHCISLLYFVIEGFRCREISDLSCSLFEFHFNCILMAVTHTSTFTLTHIHTPTNAYTTLVNCWPKRTECRLCGPNKNSMPSPMLLPIIASTTPFTIGSKGS